MNAPISQYDKVLMLGEHLGFGGVMDYAADSMDELVDSCGKHGYNTTGVPSDEYEIIKLYEKEKKWTRKELVSIINKGNVGLINHLGHANPSVNMKLNRDAVSNLTNKKYFTVYSQGCFAGAFDCQFSDNITQRTGLKDNDSISEYLTVKSNHGAVSGVWNTFFGFGKRNSTDGPSQRYHREFIDAIFGEGKSLLGVANQDSKEDNAGQINPSMPIMRWLYYGIEYLGDPALRIKQTSNSNSYKLITSVDPAGSGSIVLNPTGGFYDEGAVVTVTAVPGSGFVFDHWSGDVGGTSSSVQITIDSNKSVVAVFSPIIEQYTLTASVSPVGAGNIILSPGGNVYDVGTLVTLTATANNGFKFDHWSGDITGSDLSVDVIMDGNKTVIALFLPVNSSPFSVNITKPVSNSLYIFDHKVPFDFKMLSASLVFGSITIDVEVENAMGAVTIEFYVDDVLKMNVTSGDSSFSWTWDERAFFRHTIRVIAHDEENNTVDDSIEIIIFN